MADNYTDNYDGIATGQPLSAQKMTDALNTKEKATNRQLSSTDAAADTLTANSSDSYYPSSKLTGKNLDALKSSKQDKLSAAQLNLLNSLSTTLSALSFFPRGTILPFSSAAWDEASSEFKTIWKICDGGNGTINLVGRFIRGGAYANYGQTGGTDTTEVPYHNHGVIDPTHGHGVTDPGHNHNVAFFTGIGQSGNRYGFGWDDGQVSMQISHNNSNAIDPAGTGISIGGSGTGVSVDYAGSTTADNRPAFTTLIFIQKVA